MSTATETLSRTEHEAIVAAHVGRIEYLEYRVEKLTALLYGRSSEKAVVQPDGFVQSPLFGEIETDTTAPDEDESSPGTTERRKKRKSRTPRFSEDVEREIVDIGLEAGARCAQCDEDPKHLGFESSERLHIEPAKAKVIETRRHKFGCPCKNGGVQIAPLPPALFPKSQITDEARAHIVVQKFVDHCPYYRQASILRRNGIEISDSTLGHYGVEAADVLVPIVAIAMRDELLAQTYLQADETTLPVLKTEKQNPGAHRGYLWAFASPRGTIVFEYSRSRSQETPNGFLGSFRGKLQTDRYDGYKSLRGSEGITDIACWAHARRRFVAAAKVFEKRSRPFLDLVQRLYAIEKTARDQLLGPAERSRLRHEQSKPVLDELLRKLQHAAISERPSTPLGEAINYALDHWVALVAYVDHGEVEIDNNLIENSMRPVALGRKNYLFAGSDKGAEAAAVLYSITETCRRLGVNVHAYLCDVFRKLTLLDRSKLEHIRELTPARWKARLQAELDPDGAAETR